MKRDDKEANIIDFEDRIEIMAEDWASDLKSQDGIPFNEGLRLAEIAIRRVSRKGLRHLFSGLDKKEI
jgi:hypothetical protein